MAFMLDEDAIDQVLNNPKFKAWFGDSKVVDEGDNPLIVYHGTTHDFDEFDPRGGNIENFHGKGAYFTSDPTDASENYASRSGPDLKNRIEREAEKLRDSIDGYDDDDFAEYMGISKEEWDELGDKEQDDILYKKVEQTIVGSHEGAVIPCFLSIQNPVYVETEIILGKETIFDFEYSYDDDTDEEQINENALGYKFLEALKEYMHDYSFEGEDIDTTISNMQMEMIDSGGLRASDVEKMIRDSLPTDYETGSQASGQLLQDVYKSLGFDGVILNAGRFNMKGTKNQTLHFVPFKATQIKSIYAKEFNPNSPKIAEDDFETVQECLHTAASYYL